MTREEAGLAAITELVREETGIVLRPVRKAAILAAVERVAPGLDPAAVAAVAAGPGGQELLDHLIDEVTVQETSFARDRDQLEPIPWRRLLAAARAAGAPGLRAWSAGCASGEEAYTLALLAAEALGPAEVLGRAPVPVEVLGTDISAAALAAASRGHYGERAVRALEPALRTRYLSRSGDGSYLVRDQLRELVRFRRHNLAIDHRAPAGEAAFDVIACRNVLIYFDPKLVPQVIEGLERALRPGGVLVLGAADALLRPGRGPDGPGGQPAGRAKARGQQPWRQAAHPSRRQPDHPTVREPGHPPVYGPLGRRAELLDAALDAADHGDGDGALRLVRSLLAADPLDGDAHFIAGLVGLEAGRPAAAVAALRRALCADSSFALAAFTLGRAYDALGDEPAARRAYELALRTLRPEDDRHERMLQQIDIGDIAAACRARLAARQGIRPDGSGE